MLFSVPIRFPPKHQQTFSNKHGARDSTRFLLRKIGFLVFLV